MVFNANNSSKNSKWSKKAIAFVVGLTMAIAFVITGVAFGVALEQNSDPTAVSVTTSDIIASQTASRDPYYFAQPDSNTLIIKGGVDKNGDGDLNDSDESTAELSSGNGSVSYYQGNTFVSEIYDKRTAVRPEYEGVGSAYYLTSKISKVQIDYQIGSGTYNSKDVIYVARLTYNFEIIDENTISYHPTNLVVDFLALVVDSSGVQSTGDSFSSSTYDDESMPVSISIPWDSITGCSYKPYNTDNTITIGSASSDIYFEYMNGNVINTANSNYAGMKITATNLQSNIWIRADFETVTHTDTFNAYVADYDKTINSISDITTSSNDDYSVDNAGTVAVNYYKNGTSLVAANYTDITDTDIFNSSDNSQSVTENGNDNKGLASNDVAKVTVTPKEGYYISDVFLKYNGEEYKLLKDGYVSISDTGVVSRSKTSGTSAGNLAVTGSLLNLNYSSPNFSDGGFSFYYSGAFKDVEIFVVFKSETFLKVQIDSDNINDANALGNNAEDIKESDLSDANKKLQLFNLFVKGISLSDNSYTYDGNRLTYVEVDHNSYLAIKIPGSSNVNVIMQNDINKTAKIHEVKNKENEIITSSCGLSEKRDSMSYNALGTSNSLITINTVNERQFSFAAYIGIGNGNYREDFGQDSLDSNYLFDYSCGIGTWSDVTISTFDKMGADTETDREPREYIDAHYFGVFYGNKVVVTMANVNGYKNRQVVLASSYSSNNITNYASSVVVSIKENVPSTLSEKIDDYNISSHDIINNYGSNYGSYTAIIDPDTNDLIVTFTLDDLDYNDDFHIYTYYDAYEYTVNYNDNSGDTYGRGSDGTIKTETQYFNVKPVVDTTSGDSAFNATKFGYTLMGYVQANSPLENGVSDGTDKPDMYYVSNDNTKLIKYVDGGTYSDIEENYSLYFKDYNFSLFYVKEAYGYNYNWYDYQNDNYKLHKNLIQSELGSTVYPTDNDVADTTNCNYDGATVTLYAVWHANNYQVVYDATSNGSSDIFVDWDNDGEFDDQTIVTRTGTDYQNTSLTNTTQVNYDHAFNTSYTNGNSFSTMDGKLPTLKRDGYIFLGWSYTNFYIKYTDDLSKQVVVGDTSSGIDETNYTSQLLEPGSVFNVTEWAKWGIDETILTIAVPGYDMTTELTYSNAEANDGFIKLYAIWIVKQYKMTVDGLTSLMKYVSDTGAGAVEAAKADFGANYEKYNTFADYINSDLGDNAYVEGKNYYNYDLNDYWTNGSTHNGSSPAIITGNNQYGVQFDGEFTAINNIVTTRVGYDFDGWSFFVGDEDKLTANTILDYNLFKSFKLRDGVTAGSYDGSIDYLYEDAWIQVVPTWKAQEFTVYYSLANHTLRGYKGNRGNQVIDDISFNINSINMEYEGTTNGTTYVTQEITFDEPFTLYGFESNAYNLDGWYYYYDGSSEPKSNAPFVKIDSDTDYGNLTPNLTDYKDGFTASGNYTNNTIVKTDSTYSDTFNFSRYLFNARWADYDGAQKSYKSFKAINGLVLGNSLAGNDYYQSSTEANRKFTIFSDLSPKDIDFKIVKGNDKDNTLQQIETGVDLDDQLKAVGGYVELFQKDYTYGNSNNYSWVFNANHVEEEYTFTGQDKALESDYKVILTPYSGRYLKSVEIKYGDATVTYNFSWNPITKAVSFDGVTVATKDAGQTQDAWDNIKATLMGNGAYYVENAGYGTTADIFGVYGEHYNHTVNNGATSVYDTNPVILDIIFPKHVDGKKITITPTWGVQTYDIEIYTLKVKDTNEFNVEDGNNKIVGDSNDSNITESMGYLTELYKNWNGVLSIDADMGYERIPAYKLVGVPYGYDLHAKYSETVGDDTLTKFNAYKAEFSSDGNTFIGYNNISGSYEIWEKQYFSGYRFYDTFEYFSGYTKLDFIYESGTDINEIFIPIGEFKFFGKPTTGERISYTYNYKDSSVDNTSYYTRRELTTRTTGTPQDRDILDRNQTIYDNSVFFSVYVQTPRQSVVFHVFNPETKRYEPVDTGDDYVLAWWDGGDRYSNISDLIDGLNGIVKGMPSQNSGYWPEYTGFNGYVVGPNLKQLYGYSPDASNSGGTYLYNTDYVGKFFTNTFVELVNYHGDLYDDSNMYDIYGLFEKFTSSYMIDHEIHVYAVYDYQQFNIDNDYEYTEWASKDGNVINIGKNGDYVKESTIVFNNTTYTIKTNINLSWARTNADGSLAKTYTGDDVKAFIMSESAYVSYLKYIEQGETRETALNHVMQGNTDYFANNESYTMNGDYTYIFYYLDDNGTCYLLADNIVFINVYSITNSLGTTNFSSQSTYIGVKIKSYDVKDVSNISDDTYTLELGGYDVTDNSVLTKVDDTHELWLNQTQFEAFAEATYNGKLLIDALRAADYNGLTNQEGDTRNSDDDEYLFLYVKSSSGSIAMMSTNFVRIKDGEALIYDTSDFFDIIGTTTGSNSKNVNVKVKTGEGQNDYSETTVNVNFSISVTSYDYIEYKFIHFGIDNVAFVLLDELGFAEYQRLIDNGETPEYALLQAAVYNDTHSLGFKNYIIPCITKEDYIVPRGSENYNQLIVDSDTTPIYAVSSTILKYSGYGSYEIKSNGFRVVAARINNVKNPNYYYTDESSRDDNINSVLDTYYRNVNGDVVTNPSTGLDYVNNYFSYHINCVPTGTYRDGFVVLGQTRYNEYIRLINSGKSIEQALVEAASYEPDNYETLGLCKVPRDPSDNTKKLPLKLRDTEGDDTTNKVKGMKYIFIYRESTSSIGQSAEQIIVSSSIIVFNPDRGLVTIKPAYNYFDLSACFAKNAGNYIKPGTYDVKISFDKDTDSIVSDDTADFDIYYSLNLAYAYHSGTKVIAYTKDDIQYTVLDETQYKIYQEMLNLNYSLDYEELNADIRRIVTEGIYEAAKGNMSGNNLESSVLKAINDKTTCEESNNYYIFVHLGELSENTIFASHIINLNAQLGYAILI